MTFAIEPMGRVVAYTRGDVTIWHDEVPVSIGATEDDPVWVRPSAVLAVLTAPVVDEWDDPPMPPIGGPYNGGPVETVVLLPGGVRVSVPRPVAEVVALLWPTLEADA